jgi:DNA-binding transcriptional ArsR family regulator
MDTHMVAEIVEVPSRVSSLLNDLRHPVRLPILLALNQGDELSANQLADRIGSTYSAVAYALDRLSRAGYVEVARVEILDTVPGNTFQRLYRGRGEDWARLVAVLDEYARDG